jgi:DNA-binding FrmR family transcriptional regulator
VAAPTDHAVTPGYIPDKAALLRRLARVEGQVRGIARMIEDERYCIDILTQVGAAGTALDAVGLQVLSDHVQHCVAHALASGDRDESSRKTTELLQAVRRFTRSPPR